MQAFELLRDVEGAPHHRVAVARRLQPRLVVDRLAERDRVGRILRHQLAELVDLAVGHLQHAADVAQHAARLQRAEGDDLRHLVAAVALLDVADHLVAPVLAEVDVEVRHRHALGIEEALEQQVEAERIEVGDGQRIGDERAGARAAARPDRDALLLRPLDEVGDDQEVAGILHPLDDVELEGEPVVGSPCPGPARRHPVQRDAALQPGLAPAARSSAASSTLAPCSPTEKRGRIGARVRGRNAQRCAISTVEASASGRSANSVDHLGAGLEAVLRRETGGGRFPPGSVPRRCRSARRAPRSPRGWRKTARWWRPAARRAHRRVRSARPRWRARRRCRGAAVRRRGGRRRAAPAPRSASRPAPSVRRRAPHRAGRPARRSSAISPAVSPSSQASLMCGFSVGGVSRKARELSRIRLR